MTAPAARRSLLLFQLLVLYYLALKVWFDFGVPPMGDEAYYWMWGQRPELSYFDHPPLHGWLLGLVEKVAGWHWASVRALTWVCLAGTAAIFWSWAKKLAPDDPAGHFWHTAVLYLSTPVFWLMTTMAFNDYLVIFLCFASAWFWLDYTAAFEAGRRPRWRLYGAAVCLGLAVLTKYNAVFLGLGFAVMVLARPRLRPMLLDLHTWAAGLLAIGMQAPVFWWNFTRDFASYGFHLGTRLTGSLNDLRWLNPLDFVANMALVLSPFLFIAIWKIPFRRAGNEFERLARGFTLSTFGVSTLSMLGLALFVYIYFYWNIVAYLALIPIAFRYLGRRWLYWLHTAFGAVMALLLTVNFTLFPVVNLFGPKDWGTSANFGWDELAAAVKAHQAQYPDAFLAGTRYTYAAQLGYQLGTSDVTSFNTLPDQYDIWTDREALRGRDALIVADDAWPIYWANTQFEAMTYLGPVTITRFGREVTTYFIYRGQNYQPTE